MSPNKQGSHYQVVSEGAIRYTFLQYTREQQLHAVCNMTRAKIFIPPPPPKKKKKKKKKKNQHTPQPTKKQKKKKKQKTLFLFVIVDK